MKDHWWEDTGLPVYRAKIPRSLANEDPLQSDKKLTERLTGKVGSFAPSRRWTYFSRLHGVDAGYITPLYDLNEIAKRYGLTHNARRYFKKHILPEPFDIVRRRSVAAHHWSRFTLTALDVVLRDLERLGYRQFLSRFTGHVENLHRGAEFLEKHYGEVYEMQLHTNTDEFGVDWLT
jgi:hypothetical protein